MPTRRSGVPKPLRIYLDACVYLDAVTDQNEAHTLTATGLLQSLEVGDIQVIASELIRAEVRGRDPEANALTADFLKHSGIEWVPVSRPVADLARELGITHGLKGADAIHLATAVARGADRMMTRDPRLLSVGDCRGVPIGPPALIGQGRFDVL
jgi:predicted nucleic acid-binding protein